jgi:hypothetical protein
LSAIQFAEHLSSFPTTFIKFLMKKFLTALLTLLSFAAFAALAGCQQVVSNVTLPYEERIYIEGFLQAGYPVDNITMSVTDKALGTPNYLASITALRDADVSFSVDGQTTKATMRLDSVRFQAPTSGTFGSFELVYAQVPVFSAPSIIVQPGKTYEMLVRWRGKTVTASTRVPDLPKLVGDIGYTISPDSIAQGTRFVQRPDGRFQYDTLRVPIVRLVVKASLEAVPGIDYELGFYSTDSITRSIRTRSSSNLITNVPAGAIAGQVLPLTASANISYNVNTSMPSQTYEQARANVVKNQFYVVFVAYNPSYELWRGTQRRGVGSDGPFSAGGLNPVWNVSGDGIGIFTSYTSREVPLTIR